VIAPYQEPEFLPWDGRRVPITFIGGYLGAGKTTAINELLRNSDRPIAVVVNDVGAINIDAALIRKRHGDTIEMTNGCVCCSSIEGMGAAFDEIRARQFPPDHVIVELSGVAEPQRMIPWGQSAGFVLDGIIVVVAVDQLCDAATPLVQSFIRTQIISADLLVLTKTDLVLEETIHSARTRLHDFAPNIPIFEAGRNAFSSGSLGRFLALGGRDRTAAMLPEATLFDAHETRVVEVPSPIRSFELERLLDEIGQRENRVVRVKGIIDTHDEGLMLVQVVGNRREITKLPTAEQRDEQQPTHLVVISLK
jgi:G3E family GTPase